MPQQTPIQNNVHNDDDDDDDDDSLVFAVESPSSSSYSSFLLQSSGQHDTRTSIESSQRILRDNPSSLIPPPSALQQQQQQQEVDRKKSNSSSTRTTESSRVSSNFRGMPSIFPFGFSTSPIKTHPQRTPQQQKQPEIIEQREEEKEEMIDFTFVQESDVDEVDILLSGGDPGTAIDFGTEEHPHLDTLAILLSSQNNDSELIVSLSEQATTTMLKAVEAQKQGNMQEALDAHSAAARLFHEAAVGLREKNAAIAKSFLLLSQTEARSALGLKRIMKVRPVRQETSEQKERIRETVRGALKNNIPEKDLSESVFLGKATDQRTLHSTSTAQFEQNPPWQQQQQQQGLHPANPIDEMMKLERELRDMEMALELGNSIASLDATKSLSISSRMKNMDGSFMVVAPTAGSCYLSNSMVAPKHNPPPAVITRNTPAAPARPATTSSGMAGVRARANRVQNIAAPQTRPRSDIPHSQTNTATPSKAVSNNHHGLESSWWGTSSVASQAALVSSVVSLATTAPDTSISHSDSSAANNKQLLRLMDSMKRLGDENAALLREVEQAEAARTEARAAREEMKRFKQEYSKRFEILKNVLDKFRKNCNENYPDHPVLNSEFSLAAQASEQIARQEQLIRKLTAELKKEKEEAKKKEVIFRRYESFYREVKAMSAQKAAQRKKEQNRLPGGTGLS